jgi:CRISPR system Cascade subunit CasD
MNHTLLLRLVGPQQSWGTNARFDNRDSERAPTKSGVIGLIAAALGYPRDRDVTGLAALRMGVRIDRPGIRMRDYHTALDVVDSGDRPVGTVVSERFYLADAAFAVGLEGQSTELLQEIQEALLNPHWPLALGRRAFAPSEPVAFAETDGQPAIVKADLLDALKSCRPVRARSKSDDRRSQFILEDPEGHQEWFDQPLDNFRSRRFGPRRMKVLTLDWSES